MKMFYKNEDIVRQKQMIYSWHYLVFGFSTSLIITSDLFLFDIISFSFLAVVVVAINRKFHKDNTGKVTQVLLLPGRKLKVTSINTLGVKRSTVLPIEDCTLSSLENKILIRGKELKVVWPNSFMYLDEDTYRKYALYERAERHKRYISPFHDIDTVHDSKVLFAKRESVDEQVEFVRVESKLPELGRETVNSVNEGVSGS